MLQRIVAGHDVEISKQGVVNRRCLIEPVESRVLLAQTDVHQSTGNGSDVTFARKLFEPRLDLARFVIHAGNAVAVAEEAEDERVVGGSRTQAFEMAEACVEMASLEVNDAKRDVRLKVIGIEFQRLQSLSDGFVILATIVTNQSQGGVHLRGKRIERQSAPKFGQCFVGAP